LTLLEEIHDTLSEVLSLIQTLVKLPRFDLRKMTGSSTFRMKFQIQMLMIYTKYKQRQLNENEEERKSMHGPSVAIPNISSGEIDSAENLQAKIRLWKQHLVNLRGQYEASLKTSNTADHDLILRQILDIQHQVLSAQKKYVELQQLEQFQQTNSNQSNNNSIQQLKPFVKPLPPLPKQLNTTTSPLIYTTPKSPSNYRAQITQSPAQKKSEKEKNLFSDFSSEKPSPLVSSPTGQRSYLFHTPKQQLMNLAAPTVQVSSTQYSSQETTPTNCRPISRQNSTPQFKSQPQHSPTVIRSSVQHAVVTPPRHPAKQSSRSVQNNTNNSQGKPLLSEYYLKKVSNQNF